MALPLAAYAAIAAAPAALGFLKDIFIDKPAREEDAAEMRRINAINTRFNPWIKREAATVTPAHSLAIDNLISGGAQGLALAQGVSNTEQANDLNEKLDELRKQFQARMTPIDQGVKPINPWQKPMDSLNFDATGSPYIKEPTMPFDLNANSSPLYPMGQR